MKPVHRTGGIALMLLLATALPAQGNQEQDRTRVAILMFDGVQIIDFAAPYEVFGQAGFEIYTVSADGEAVTTAMNLGVMVDHSFASAPTADVIVVPGGDVHAAEQDAAVLEWIRSNSASADHVLSICTGSFILASSGLLDGRRATTFHRALDGMAEQYPQIEVVRDQRWVDSGKVVTSAGLASGIDAALHVVAEILGEKKARSVALHLEYDWSPEQGFIRGLMADQHSRMPAEPMQFPEGTVIDRQYAVGDKTFWEEAYLITSPWSPSQLLDHMRERAEDDPALQVLENPDPAQLAWEFASERGGRWRVSFTAGDPTDEGYRVTSKLVQLD